MSSNLFRTSSGVWKVASAEYRSSSTPVPARPVQRALPTAAKDRSAVLLEQARSDLTRGKLASAETNLRLALTFCPGDEQVATELHAVIAMRDQERREAGLHTR